jgi:hypothetical protein
MNFMCEVSMFKNIQLFFILSFTIIGAGCSNISKRDPATSLQNYNDIVEGKIFCREVISDGSFGQPKGKRSHCVSFKNGVMTDNANTFFGNPPERASFLVTFKNEILIGSNLTPKFLIIDDQTIKILSGEYELKLRILVEENTQSLQSYNDIVEGKMFCREVISDGSFGQPKGKRSHCVSFKNGVMTDNANTFFGNPPERETFLVSYKNEILVGSSLTPVFFIKDKTTLIPLSGNYELKLK